MEQAIVGVFETESDAIIARESLCSAGFNPTNVRKILPGDIETTTTADEDEGIGGFFSRLFGTDDHPHVEEYSAALSHGHPVLVVQASSNSEADRAKDIMEQCGAIDVEERVQTWLGSDMTTDVRAVRSSDIGTTVTDTGKQTIPVVEEQMTVDKRTVDRGGVRIYMRETERPVEETVNLREERVIIERRPVDRLATAADMNTAKERVFDIRTTAEEAVIAKTAHVVEEVEIGKETIEHSETVRDTVRRTDVDVENVETTSETGRVIKRPNPEQRLTP